MNASVRIEGFGETVDIRLPMNNLGLQLGFIDNVLSIICMLLTQMEKSRDLSLEERDVNCQKLRKQKESLVRLKKVCRKNFLDREQEDFLPLQASPTSFIHADQVDSAALMTTTAVCAHGSSLLPQDPRAPRPRLRTSFGFNSWHVPRMRLSHILSRRRVAPVEAAVQHQSSGLVCNRARSVSDFSQIVCVADAPCTIMSS